ncbi:MAG: ThuA domain-containing protein [Bacteroidota bacterium]
MRLKKLALISLFIFPYPLSAQGGEILHYTETTGYNHNTANQSRTLFEDIANQLGLPLVHDTDGSQFNSLNNLQRFDLVIFSNTSGNNGLNANQRSNFEQYIAGGGSYLGIHAASDTYRHSSANGNSTGTWDWYAETVCGASVQQAPNHTANNYAGVMTFLVTGGILDYLMPQPWNKNEEYYYWENGYLSPNFTTLLEVAQTGNQSYDVARMMAQYRDLPGGGRSFYTSLGHSANNYNLNTDFGQLMKNAVDWIRAGSSLPIEFEEEEVLRKFRPRIQNPSRDKLKFFIHLDESIPLEMELYDMQGNKLYSLREDNPARGNWVWEKEIRLARGHYQVLVHSLGKGILSEILWIQ